MVDSVGNVVDSSVVVVADVPVVVSTSVSYF